MDGAAARGERNGGAGARALRLCAFAALLIVAACGVGQRAADAPPPAAPAAVGPPRARVEPDPAAADELTSFYAGVQGELTASGRMRLDTAPPDAPFTVDDLVRNFERIALHDEYVDVGGRFVRREAPALLRRWERPVRVGVVIGPSVPPQDAARDRADIAAYTARLARLTGLDMRMGTGAEVNFLVMVLSSDEQAVAADATAAALPGFQPAVLGAIASTPIDTFCTAYAFAEPTAPSTYAAVMVLIRAEHPALTRLSCVNEEMAQAMGLPNDSPDARPSLFNDSLEFAFLTEHDEILLRMLYDPRLRPGMTIAEARPLLPAIARDAMAAQSGGAHDAARVM
ncbi:DUF2927 domain-containing protein [Amaricoccus sp.]|uniref:DUF2927 domain-containing protein n=1 Tax=Amaricoccus sp. TaxID=1872485 RepID=UPI001B3D5886|nr:DUF2927 domain-containing protein [Amaricoccus sp.]MBP7242905.1 DUF2927 domain-containing protein [Amaricoccus sp.]